MKVQANGREGMIDQGVLMKSRRWWFALPVVAGLLVISSGVQAAGVDLFQQNGAPIDGNVSVAINNPQNMSGGNWSGANSQGQTPTYPAGGNSAVLDGDMSTAWSAGVFSDGGMANIAMTQGYFSLDQSSFTNVAFGKIGTIRIYTSEQPTPSGQWNNFAKQVSVAYTTNAFNPGSGYSYNSNVNGEVPSTWNNIATITAVNGSAPVSPSDSTYSIANGWVAADFSQGITNVTTGNYAITEAYMDLTLNIPVGATSVLISFGQENGSTGNQGGLQINEIQAFVPEPASLSVLGMGFVGLLSRRRRPTA